MRIVTVGLVGVVLAFCCVNYAAAADDCPKTDGPITEEDLRATPNCAAAVALHARCSLGSSGDTILSKPVYEKCEPMFLPKLNAPQKRAYRRALSHCARPQGPGEGSMNVSFEILCEEAVLLGYAGRYGGR
jgi:hypothetical protein